MLQRYILALLTTSAMLGAAWADTPAGAPDVHVGDYWHYRTADGFTNETKLEFTYRIVDLNDREITFQLQNKNVKATELRYYNHDLNSLDIGDTKYEPYYPSYKFPMSVGLTWKQEFHSLNRNAPAGSAFMNGRVVAWEKVTVPAGVFDAFKIENDVDSQGTDENANTTKAHKITWYAPAVKNYVRIESTVSSEGRVRSKSINELVEYSLRGKPELKN